MGKKKHKKFGAPKCQPTGLPSINQDDEDEVLDVKSPTVVADVLEQLQSGEEATRECGCGTLAALALQPGAVPVLLKANVVRILAPLVVDPSPYVRHRALGALRNMTVEGGAAVCEKMVDDDVLTALMALFKQYGPGWEVEGDSAKQKTKKYTDTKMGIFTEAVHVLWNLCEASDTAVNAFNRDHLLPDLLPCLQYSVYGYPLATVVAQCLHTVTEGNQDAVRYCRGDDILPSLLSLVQQSHTSSQGMLFQATMLGILSSVLGGEMLSGQALGSAVGVFSQILDVDITSSIADLLSKPQQNGTVNGGGDHSHEDDDLHRLGSNSACSDLINVIDAKRVCFELITNMCCSPDDEWEDVSSNTSSSSEELVDDVDMEQDAGDATEDNFNPLCAPSEVHAAFVASNIVPKVVKSTCPLPAEVSEQVRTRPWGKQVLSKLTRLRTSALLCTNNLVDSMEIEALGGMEALHQLWDTLAQQVHKPAIQTAAATASPSTPSPADADLLDAMTSAMRAVIQKLAQLKSPKFAEVSPSDVQFLVKMAEGANSGVQVHVMRIVATIATLLAKAQPEHAVVQDVGSFLVTVASHGTDLVVVAEALDALFDVFSDDATDPIARRLGLTERLSSILPHLKAKLQGQKRTLGENYVTVATAKTNLIRFIKYKQSMAQA